ncbi:MAG: hypothetical protein F8N37_20515 [Telmatospirillum sp.]|nr:hypothetical protein [Telmatospirillum sp.]
MGTLAVAINFCGGCNPAIDRREIASEIEQALTAAGYAVTYNDWDADFLVRLSGCEANCAFEYHPSDRPDAVVAGRTFAAVKVAEDSLPGRVVAAVKDHFERPHRDNAALSSDGPGGAGPEAAAIGGLGPDR